MSQTTTTVSTIDTIEQAVLTSLPGLIGMAFAGRLAPVSVKVQAGLVTADTDAAAALTKLQGELDTLEASDPLVQKSIAAGAQILTTLGLALPTEAEVFEHFKAAANDVLAGLKA